MRRKWFTTLSRRVKVRRLVWFTFYAEKFIPYPERPACENPAPQLLKFRVQYFILALKYFYGSCEVVCTTSDAPFIEGFKAFENLLDIQSEEEALQSNAINLKPIYQP